MLPSSQEPPGGEAIRRAGLECLRARVAAPEAENARLQGTKAAAEGPRDATDDHKHVEAALRESEERFRRTADTAPALLWMTDAKNRCVYLSRSWHEFTGQMPKAALAFGWLNA